MPYRLFHDFFPEVAEQETRSIWVPAGINVGLPVGEYAFPEMFCDEIGCDCRRVFFYVVSVAQPGRLEAVVVWGWEKRDFYRRWMNHGDEMDLDLVKGPALNPTSPQSGLAPAILDLVRYVLLDDALYIARIKRHYAMFREKIDGHGDEGRTRRRPKPRAACREW